LRFGSCVWFKFIGYPFDRSLWSRFPAVAASSDMIGSVPRGLGSPCQIESVDEAYYPVG
jgi:hypothetical protein